MMKSIPGTLRMTNSLCGQSIPHSYGRSILCCCGLLASGDCFTDKGLGKRLATAETKHISLTRPLAGGGTVKLAIFKYRRGIPNTLVLNCSWLVYTASFTTYSVVASRNLTFVTWVVYVSEWLTFVLVCTIDCLRSRTNASFFLYRVATSTVLELAQHFISLTWQRTGLS